MVNLWNFWGFGAHYFTELLYKDCYPIVNRNLNVVLKKKHKIFPQALKRSDAAGFMSELKLRPPTAKSGFLAALGMTFRGRELGGFASSRRLKAPLPSPFGAQGQLK